MSNWWDSAPVVGQPAPSQAPAAVPAPAPQDENWWKNAQLANAADRKAVESGDFLPISRYNDGKWGFDSNAGIVGTIKRALMLPGDVYTGKIDPMSNEGKDRAMDLAGIVSPVNPAVRIGERAIPGPKMALERVNPKPPTREELAALASKQYNAARDMGVDFSSQAIADVAQSARAGLDRDGIIAKLAPKTHGIIDELANPPPGSVAPLSGVEAARRALGHAARSFDNPTEQLAAKRAMGTMDGFLNQPDPSSVVAGPAAAAIDALTSARGNFAASKRSETLSGIGENAARRSATANSGQNLDNTIRSRVASALERPKVSGGFDDAERAALEAVAQGTPVTNTARTIGNLLGGGGGLGAGLTGGLGSLAGASLGGPAGAAVGASLPVIGWASKQAANALTNNALSKVDALTRTRSPLYQQMLRDTPMTPISPERRAAAIRALLLGGFNQGPQGGQ